MKPIFLDTLTGAINAFLKLDPDSQSRLKRLSGKAIAIELLPFNFTILCVFFDDHLQLTTDDTQHCDTTLRGTPLQLLGVMLTQENRQRFFADDLKIEGNAEFGQQVVELFDHIDIDWEEHLSKLIGDIPAYRAGQFARGVRSWFANLNQQLTQDINEYVHEEAGWLPTREALQDFFTEVDDTRLAIDRLEARLKHLQQILTSEQNRESH